ncbi:MULTISPECIES: hypothetical protein [unclassified Bradyrhizobium]|uniref:hypothetical protein n=1 Tax=unclassified Bradyrhizobium TaxID=2631580 RepID=UPI002916D384|nr:MULTISPECIES: hypothetical protein [unclassified Bradyrhizobium]
MREDFRVATLDSLEIWEIAKAQRGRLVRKNADRVDLLGCLETTKEIWTLSGRKPFRFVTVADEEMPAQFCWAHYDGTGVIVKAPQILRHRALIGDGDARFVIARGLGTATLHLEALLERSGQSRPLFEKVVGACSSQWQGGLFATGFLVDDTAWRLPSFEAISIQAGIGVIRAKTFLTHMDWAVSRSDLDSRLRAIADKVRQAAVCRR